MYNEAIIIALRTVIVFFIYLFLKSKVETLGFMVMEMPLFFKFLYFWFLFGLLCSDLFIVWLNVRVWNGGEQQNEGRRLCRVTDFGAWRRGLLCFFCFFALFGSRDYEGKWMLGKQKGNIIKKKKKCKKK